MFHLGDDGTGVLLRRRPGAHRGQIELQQEAGWRVSRGLTEEAGGTDEASGTTKVREPIEAYITEHPDQFKDDRSKRIRDLRAQGKSFQESIPELQRVGENVDFES